MTKEPVKETSKKSGINTSEFWVTIISMVVIGAVDLIGFELDATSVENLVNIALGYVLGRSGLKSLGALSSLVSSKK